MIFMLCRNINCINRTYHNLIRCTFSSGISQTILGEKFLEEPIIMIQEDYNVDIIGPPDPVSNLRPIIRRHIMNETALQQKFREMQDATQDWNQKFWTKHNSKFLKERRDYIKSHNESTEKKESLTADEMSEFYKKFLDENWGEHVKYNFKWYKRNIILLVLALRVTIEKFQQKF